LFLVDKDVGSIFKNTGADLINNGTRHIQSFKRCYE